MEIRTYKTSADGTCPMCSDVIYNEFLLGKHLLAAHKVCINTKMKVNGNEDWYANRWYSIGEDDYTIVLLGNKMRALKCILKDYFPMYIEKLKEWINCKISRTEFEEHVRPFFDENSVLIHNEFLICFLNEIRSYKQETNDNVETSTSFASLPIITEQETKVSGAAAESCLPANGIDIDMRKMSVPDDETCHALTLVNVWEGNCTDVNKRVVPLLHNTKGVLAKLIRDAILYRKKAIFVRPDGSEYDATDMKDEDVMPDDVPKYSGNSITVGEIKDAIINEKNLHQFKHLLPLFLNRDI